MLDHLGETGAAAMILRAIEQVLAAGLRTRPRRWGGRAGGRGGDRRQSVRLSALSADG